uniref:carbonic anhydrase n=1 Tax=Strigamia maritima TaxID=126957 RepID=T1IM50_STRMM
MLSFITNAKSADWSYGGNSGPDFWCQISSGCCGQRQSPVDLNLLKISVKSAFQFVAYDQMPASATMVNNGHSIAVTFSSDIVPRIHDGGLNSTYFFHSLHMHWGSQNNRGSEHTFARRSFPMEMHLVHYNAKFASLGAAIQSRESDALAVLGVMFEVGLTSHPSLGKMTARMGSVQYNGQSTSIESFSLGSMLPSSRALFYRYAGSLTTPSCDEVVAWTVFMATTTMSSQQLESLRQVYASNRDEEPPIEMSDNYRPVHNQKKWCEISDSCCGKYQSPIELWDNERKTQMTPFVFINYSVLPKTVAIENNGHTITLTFTGVTPKISGGGLRHTYILSSLHFHWGVNNYQGAEHILNNRQAPMELHMVHYKSKFSNLTEAISSGEKDALAVLGVLYWIDNRNSNPSLDQITSRLRYVKYNGQSTQIKSFSLRKLIPASTTYFFRYWGSLTTPTCDEVVVWTVFREPGFLTNAQMNAFRATYSTGENEAATETIANNYRQVQRLNRRTVYQGKESRYGHYHY